MLRSENYHSYAFFFLNLNQNLHWHLDINSQPVEEGRKKEYFKLLKVSPEN